MKRQVMSLYKWLDVFCVDYVLLFVSLNAEYI